MTYTIPNAISFTKKEIIVLHILIVLASSALVVESLAFVNGDYSRNSNGIQWARKEQSNHVCYASSVQNVDMNKRDDEEEGKEVEIKEGNQYEHILHEKNIQFTISRSMNDESNQRPTNVDIETSEPINKMKNLAKNLVSIYLHFLAKHELLTKCLTSGVIGIIGDFLAQCFEYSVKQQSVKTVHTLDRIRLFGIFFESTLISGPLMHYAYDYMEYLVPVHNNDLKGSTKVNTNPLSSWIAPGIHVLADVVILGPIFVFTMMLFTSIIEGRISTCTSEFVLDYGPALRASTVASLSFVPIQLIAFKCLPIKFRLLYMNFQDVIWNAVVSVMAHKSRK